MPPTTFTEAAEQYLENLDLENGRNIPDKRRQLKQELIPYFGNMALTDINRFEIERFKRHLLKKSFSQSTINRYLAVISQLFHKAVEWDWLVKVPCKVVKYREDNIRTRYLEAQEIESLMAAATKDERPVIESFICIALATAMRRGEVFAIKVAGIILPFRSFLQQSQLISISINLKRLRITDSSLRLWTVRLLSYCIFTS